MYTKDDRMKKFYAFTLAEVLITLAIIGVVAAISIPSVISNSQQQEFKTGLRKAVSVLNSAITMNMALDGESPYDNANLMGFLMKHMSVIRTTKWNEFYFYLERTNVAGLIQVFNYSFYTNDGMIFHFPRTNGNGYPLYESDIKTNSANSLGICGSYGLNSNSNNTTKPPCVIAVDVNGDRKPNPANVMCEHSAAMTYACSSKKRMKMPLPTDKKLIDVFTVMITDKEAIPYGVTAQKAMYNSQK